MGIREFPKPINPVRKILEYNRTRELFYTRPLKMWGYLCLAGKGEGEGKKGNNPHFIILIYLRGHPYSWDLFHVS